MEPVYPTDVTATMIESRSSTSGSRSPTFSALDLSRFDFFYNALFGWGVTDGFFKGK